MAAPRGSKAEREAAWREWDLTLEMLRILVGESDLWKSTFSSIFHEDAYPSRTHGVS